MMCSCRVTTWILFADMSRRSHGRGKARLGGHVRLLSERVPQQALARARDHERGVNDLSVVYFAAGFPR
jgi:hypothetical protein